MMTSRFVETFFQLEKRPRAGALHNLRTPLAFWTAVALDRFFGAGARPKRPRAGAFHNLTDSACVLDCGRPRPLFGSPRATKRHGKLTLSRREGWGEGEVQCELPDQRASF